MVDFEQYPVNLIDLPGYGGTTTARDAGRVCYSHEYIGKK
jgi:hypothetical protein